MRILVLVLFLVVSVFMVMFGVQNPQAVTVQFMGFSSGSVSLSLVIIVAVLSGALLCALLWMWSSISRSIRERGVRKTLEKRNRELEDQVAQLQRAASITARAAAPPAAPVEPKVVTK